ncbi:glutamate carboxypeptidase [Nonomuraea solani]|uniref:Glutamate carboxypeptidase n=2 Tax=Nonomuraea solani TaxID=1144553 RepID=A0A1H6EWP6_9ACTN|nr:glutamate carboxypeptidase [Nonomuraea solani]
MKAGLVQLVWALRALEAAGLARPPLRLLLNGDEEIGSPASRPLIEAAAEDAAAVLVFEASADGAVMERGPGTARLFAKARAVAARMGLDLCECSVGGASDGNFAAALGRPVLDGLGAVGAGAHARHEHISVDGMLERATLTAALLHELA